MDNKKFLETLKDKLLAYVPAREILNFVENYLNHLNNEILKIQKTDEQISNKLKNRLHELPNKEKDEISTITHNNNIVIMDSQKSAKNDRLNPMQKG